MDTISIVKDTVWVYTQDTVFSVVKDTIVIYDIPPELLSTYTDILKSTNEQLGLWHNPYGILITTLAVLFTLLTILAAIIIWTQGKSFKELVNNTINKYEGILSSFIKQKKEELANIDKNIDNSIAAHKKELEKASANQKKEIEKKIEELRIHKEAIQKELENPIVTPVNLSNQTGPGYYSNQVFHKCSKCGFGFLYSNPLYSSFGDTASLVWDPIYGTVRSKAVTCPKCNNVDQI